MPDITAALDEKKLRILKDYPSEILVGILIISIVGLWGKMVGMESKIDGLQVEIKTYMNEDRKVLLQTLDNTTEAMKQNTNTLIDVADYLRIAEVRQANDEKP